MTRANRRNAGRKDDALGFNRLSGFVLERSESDVVEEAFGEWEPIGFLPPNDDYDQLVPPHHEADHCACGQSNVLNRQCLRNTLNGNLLWPVGTNCIERFGGRELRLSVRTWISLRGLRSGVLNGLAERLPLDDLTKRDLVLLLRLRVIKPFEFQILMAKRFSRKTHAHWWEKVSFLSWEGPSQDLFVEGIDWLPDFVPRIFEAQETASAEAIARFRWDGGFRERLVRGAVAKVLDEGYDALAEQSYRNCLLRIISCLDLEDDLDSLLPLEAIRGSHDAQLEEARERQASMAEEARAIADVARRRLASGHSRREVLEMGLRPFD